MIKPQDAMLYTIILGNNRWFDRAPDDHSLRLDKTVVLFEDPRSNKLVPYSELDSKRAPPFNPQIRHADAESLLAH